MKSSQPQGRNDERRRVTHDPGTERKHKSEQNIYILKVPCPITRPLVCYEAFSACKRSAESQTLKVHPVASKTLTQKIPVYAAPERFVGHFSFSSWVKWRDHTQMETVARLHCRCAAFGGAGGLRVLVNPRRWGCCSLLSTPPFPRPFAMSRSKQEMTPVTQLTLSAPHSSEPRNVLPPDPTQHSHLFLITGVIFWLLTPL